MEEEKLEEALVERAKRDPESFALLYDLYFKRIYNYIFYRVRSHQTAEDLVSETFFKALRGLEGFTQYSSFGSWLYRIAHNVIVDYYRKEKETSSLEDLEFALGSGSDLAEQVEVSIQHQDILAVIETMPPHQRDILIMRFVDDLTINEIARVLEKPEGTIKTNLFRGLKKVRELLKGGESYAETLS